MAIRNIGRPGSLQFSATGRPRRFRVGPAWPPVRIHPAIFSAVARFVAVGGTEIGAAATFSAVAEYIADTYKLIKADATFTAEAALAAIGAKTGKGNATMSAEAAFVADTISDRNLALTAITKLGLTSGLQLVLDAGDAASYTSGQSWLDRSGNGYDFFLGADGSATASDPTFTGSAGDLDAYFAHDGGDYFTYDAANEAWMETLHKDNAAFTFVLWLYAGSAATASGVLGTNGGSTANVGIEMRWTAGANLVIAVTNGSGNALSAGAGPIIGSAWNFIGISINEATGANGYIHNLNGTVTLLTSTYSSPSASNAAHTLQLGSRGNANLPIANLSRFGIVMAWSTALSQANLAAIYNATRGRYGV